MSATITDAKYGINPSTAMDYIIQCMGIGLPTMLHGSPGVGKSGIYKALKEKYNLELIDIRLSQTDPLDLNGMLAKKGDRGTYLPMEMWPLETDDIPKGKNGYLILLDEINSAPLLTQAAAYSVVYDKVVGLQKLHKKCIIGAAGNLITDQAIVNRLSTAMQSRLGHFLVVTDPKQWTGWAAQNHLAPEVISYINFEPSMLHKMDHDADDFTFSCPRTWEFISKLVIKYGLENLDLPLIVGIIGETAAIKFNTYSKVYGRLPSMGQIERDPKNADLPSESIVQTAIAGMIGAYTDDKNIDKIIHYIDRMGIEFQSFAVRDIVNRESSMIHNLHIERWLDVNSEHFV